MAVKGYRIHKESEVSWGGVDSATFRILRLIQQDYPCSTQSVKRQGWNVKSLSKALKCLRMLCVSICIWNNGQVRLARSSTRSFDIFYHLKISCFSVDGVTGKQYEKSGVYALIC